MRHAHTDIYIVYSNSWPLVDTCTSALLGSRNKQVTRHIYQLFM